MKHLKYLLIVILLGWCINVYGQEPLTDTTGFSDITWTKDNVTSSGDIFYPWLHPTWVAFVELYEEYETHCFNDSTEQCFKYYRGYHPFEEYKKPCFTKYDFEISLYYTGIGKEWVHIQPSFIGFMQYIKEKRDEIY